MVQGTGPVFSLVQGTGSVVSLVQGTGSVVSLVQGYGPVVSLVHGTGPVVSLVQGNGPVVQCTGPVQEAGGVAADQDRHGRGGLGLGQCCHGEVGCPQGIIFAG